MKIALTQSEGRLVGLAEALTERGHEVIRQPLIRTEPLVSEEVRGQAERLLACDWLLFTSSSAVEAWHALGLPLNNIHPRVGVVGEKTAEVILSYGGEVSLIGEPQNAEGLATVFLEQEVRGQETKGQEVERTVGLPQGNRSLQTLKERLGAHGVQTFPVTLYETVTCPWQAKEVDAVVLASPSAAQALPEEVGKRVTLVLLGPSTSAAIARRGWRYVQAEMPSAKAILKILEREAEEKEEVKQKSKEVA